MKQPILRLRTALALIAAVALAADVPAEKNPQHLKPVSLNVIAIGHHGHPVLDLSRGDLSVVDNASPQQITMLSPNRDSPRSSLVIFFDLMDLTFGQRGQVARRLRESIGGADSSVPLYLYLLEPNGSLYPVIRPLGSSAALATGPERSLRIGALLDQALRRVTRPRAVDMDSSPRRFNAAFEALTAMDREISVLAGRKQVLWITYGVPSSIHFAGGWADLAPTLRKLAAQFNKDQVAIYTLDPGLQLGTLNRDGLNVLSAATGGRALGVGGVKDAMIQIQTDASSSYLLEYGPPLTDNWQGKYHKVRVTCQRKGVRLFTQQVYLAAAE